MVSRHKRGRRRQSGRLVPTRDERGCFDKGGGGVEERQTFIDKQGWDEVGGGREAGEQTPASSQSKSNSVLHEDARENPAMFSSPHSSSCASIEN